MSVYQRLIYQPVMLLLTGFFPAVAHAEKEVVATPKTDVSSLSNWPVVLLVLAGMVVFILALAWFAKRFGGLNISGNRDMRIISAIQVGTRERIALLDVKGQQFLIGVTAQQITHLHSFDEAVVSDAKPEPAFRQSEFFNKLQLVMNPQKKTKVSEAARDTHAGGSGQPEADQEQSFKIKRDDNAL